MTQHTEADYGICERVNLHCPTVKDGPVFMPAARTAADVGYNTKIKVYPDSSTAITVCNRAIFRPPGWEPADRRMIPERKGRNHSAALATLEISPQQPPQRGGYPSKAEWLYSLGCNCPTRQEWEAAQKRQTESLARSRRRAMSALRDIALANPDMDHFVTLTVSPEYERDDPVALTKRLNRWLDNAVRRHGLKYVLVPEYHKKGGIHFHGLFNRAMWPDGHRTYSGTIIPPEGGKPRKPRSNAQAEDWLLRGGHIVYNLPAWEYGFTTAIELYGPRSAAVGYVTKYIGKTDCKVGGRWYYSGGDLQRPEIQYDNTDGAELADDPMIDSVSSYSVPAAGLIFDYAFIGYGG